MHQEERLINIMASLSNIGWRQRQHARKLARALANQTEDLPGPAFIMTLLISIPSASPLGCCRGPVRWRDATGFRSELAEWGEGVNCL